jgi:2,3-bisphosphoglycerate-independent phosphoglycerate mutase
MKRNTPLLLAVLDGVGLNPNESHNAVFSAHTPVLDSLLASCPSTSLCSFGEVVGLPNGQMGNSEVGHLTIGSGRIIEQDLTRINKAAAKSALEEIPVFYNAIKNLTPANTLHLIGLCSKGGVHSDLGHLTSILTSAAKCLVPCIVVHVITDGRDRPQKEAIKELIELEAHIKTLSISHPGTHIHVGSLIGRYFAMDRDKRWERTEKAYNLFTKGIGQTASSLHEALNASYENNTTDEFIEPVHFTSSHPPCKTSIDDGDCILFFNFRADRMRQIVSSFYSEDWNYFPREKKITLSFIMTLTEYDETFPCEVLFPSPLIKNCLGEVLSSNGYSQLRIAETEKYPHVTYFFNGGNELSFKGEERIMAPSPREVKTYDLKPEMSAYEITEILLAHLDTNPPDTIILNFANGDMVGHTGDFNATVKAVETVDTCLGTILEKIKSLGGVALITADHGNADQMIDYETGEPHTYHTTHPVPLILFNYADTKKALRDGGSLCDIAPTFLDILGIKIPSEMSGRSLLITISDNQKNL